MELSVYITHQKGIVPLAPGSELTRHTAEVRWLVKKLRDEVLEIF